MVAGKYNITCQQGSTFDLQLTLQYTNPDYPGDCADPNVCPEFLPWDLTDYTARMQVRKYIDSATKMLELTTENTTSYRITLGNPDAVDGTISLFIRAEDTRNNQFTPTSKLTSGVYDIEIISPTNEVDRILQGEFILSPEVTQ
jgi:hypothetical protein